MYVTVSTIQINKKEVYNMALTQQQIDEILETCSTQSTTDTEGNEQISLDSLSAILQDYTEADEEDEDIDEEDDYDEDDYDWDDAVSDMYPNSSYEEIEEELGDRFCKD